jgi:hypothetical protein
VARSEKTPRVEKQGYIPHTTKTKKNKNNNNNNNNNSRVLNNNGRQLMTIGGGQLRQPQAKANGALCEGAAPPPPV